MDYPVWKLLHITSVVVFIGNIATGLFWAAHAHRTRDFRVIASTFDGINRSDRWFTIPGVVGIIVTGVALALTIRAPILGTGWILWAIVLFGLSGAVFGAFVAPLQNRIAQLAHAVAAGTDDGAAYDALYRRVELWGLVALVLPVAAMVIMVLKPALVAP